MGWLAVIVTCTSMIEERVVSLGWIFSILSIFSLVFGGTYLLDGCAIFMIEFEDRWLRWYPERRWVISGCCKSLIPPSFLSCRPRSTVTIDGYFLSSCWYVVRFSWVCYCLILGTGDLITGFLDVYIIILSICGLLWPLGLLIMPGICLLPIWKLFILLALLSDWVMLLSIR